MLFNCVRAIKINRKRLVLVILLAVAAIGCLIKVIAAEEQPHSTEALSWALLNKTIVIDPGHGGVDPGAQGRTALEKDINLEVGRRLADILRQAGADVIMTREEDTDLRYTGEDKYSKTMQREDLKNRAQIANDHRADLFISLHVDKIAQSEYSGAAVLVHPQGADSSLIIAEEIQKGLREVLGNTKRAVSQSDLYILEQCTVPAVLVEMGFLSNEKEEQLLLDDRYQDRMAWAIYTGIVSWYIMQPDIRDQEQVRETFQKANSNINNLKP